MDEAKPIVTYHGNKNLFSSLHQQLCQGLPKKFCEWRRSYGRPSRSVYLDVTYVPYDEDILPGEEERTLVSRPYFHVYWTDCDLDGYKQSVKEDIAEWLTGLKNKNIQDWLIVVVTTEESKVKAKILPRSSVIDKVKSDFCSKYSDKCIVLSDPLKLDSKSSESWAQLFDRLRPLLLQAFNQVLNKFEENMRSRREKRNEPGWNYFSYFIVQEELAFMLEVLGLKEDALVQYDELDAMFDQFVENHANGKMVKWLSPLMEPCSSWAGLSLTKSLDLDLREEIKQSNVSLLEFRNYLFSRQAALLFQMRETGEVARRAMGFLYHTLTEMKALEVEVHIGGLDCWLFLSCLEVLNTCTRHHATKVDEKFAMHTATLWDFARKKLGELGLLCGLMPGTVPTSQQLGLVVDLVSGMAVQEDSLELASAQKPVDKLRESLSSPDSFKNNYLEICEQAMGTYKYIGRFRSSRMIGKEIADFYLKVKEPQKAEGFLMDAISMYQQEGWHQLADSTMKQLAACQRMLEGASRYVRTVCHIASSLHLSSQDKEDYFHKTMETLPEVKDDIEMRASQAFFVDGAFLDQSSVCIHSTLTFNLLIYSNFVKPLTLDTVKVSIRHCSEKEIREIEAQQASRSVKTKRHKRQPSTIHLPSGHMTNFQPVKSQLPDTITLRSTVELQKRRVASSGIVCDVAHVLLKRADSSTSDKHHIVKADYSHSFSLDNVVLQPGQNSLSFSKQINQEGTFRLEQMCFSLNRLHLLKPLTSTELVFNVLTQPPQFELSPKHTEYFIAGIQQEAIFKFTSGSTALHDGSTLSFSSSPMVTISKQKDADDVCLPSLPELSPCEIPVLVRSALKSETPLNQSCQVNLAVDKLGKSFSQDLVFARPFQVSLTTHTASTDKYVQVSILGCVSTFSVSNFSLIAPDYQEVELELLNPKDAVYPLIKENYVMLLWKLNLPNEVIPSLDLVFTCSYTSSLDCACEPWTFSSPFTIRDFQTQFILSYDVTSMEEDKACVSGESAVIDIKIKQADSSVLADGIKLAYTVKANGSIWAIGGKTSGIFTMKEGKHSIALDVVPMKPGFLFLPLVTLYSYTDLLEENSKHDSDGGEDSDNDSALLRSAPAHNVKQRSSSDSSSSQSSSLVTSQLIEFRPGQIYNQSGNKQVHVMPCKNNASVDVSLVSALA